MSRPTFVRASPAPAKAVCVADVAPSPPAGGGRRTGARRFGPSGLALLVTAVLVAVTVVTALAWRERIRADERRTFLAGATQVERRLTADLDRVEATLVTVADEIGRTSDLTAARFGEQVMTSVPVEVPSSVVTVAVVEPIGADEVDDFVQARREDGLTAFQVRDAGTDELAVATFERSGGTAPFFDGLDLAALPEARSALDAAAASGALRSSDVLGRLPTADRRLLRSGFLVVAPVYDGAVVPGRPDRSDQLDRWVVALVDGGRLLDAAVLGAEPGIDAQLATADGQVVASTAVEEGGGAGATTIDLTTAPSSWVETVALGPRAPLQLTVARLDAPGGAAGTDQPTVLLVVGTFVSVLLGALVWALARTRAGALALAASATDTLRASEEQFRSVVQNLSDIVLLLDEAGTIRYASPSVRELLGWPPKQTVGSSVFDGMHPDDEPLVREAMVDASLREPRRPVGTRRLIEVRMRHAEGSFRQFEATVSDVVDTAVGGLVFTAHDVSHRIATEERLAHDATHDPLTNLPNRTLLDDRLGHALDRARRTGAEVAVLFLDLDGFKDVNDTWGHATGDRVLAEVAERVAATARASDTVARLGGDEFVVVCEDAGSAAGAQTLAGRILEAIGAPITVGGVEHRVGASVGIVVADEGERDPEELIRQADAAMYRAKQSGRGGVELASAADADGSAAASGPTTSS